MSPTRARLGRRAFLVGGLSVVLAMVWSRLRLRPGNAWQGTTLTGAEATVLRAAAAVLLPKDADLTQVSLGADAYVASLPLAVRREIGLLLRALEQAPTGLGITWARFCDATPKQRHEALNALRAKGGDFTAAYHGVRDLCLVGFYQQPSSWGRLGYSGPIVNVVNPPRSPLLAGKQTLPRGSRRMSR